mmetsp:Transcript_86258/g.167148  ORF Transcript_86258/g.167148 Transcript_86258/m.167148 type:complete len:107 (+) Transcript_86258:206-526(+)
MLLKPPWNTIENMEVVAILYKKSEDLRSLSPTMPCLTRSFSLHQEECQIASFWEDERLGKIAIVKNHPFFLANKGTLTLWYCIKAVNLCGATSTWTKKWLREKLNE